MGPGAETAGPAIKTMLRDPDDSVRRDAEKALMKINPDLLHASQVELSADAAANIERLIRDLRNGSVGEQLRAVHVEEWVVELSDNDESRHG